MSERHAERGDHELGDQDGDDEDDVDVVEAQLGGDLREEQRRQPDGVHKGREALLCAVTEQLEALGDEAEHVHLDDHYHDLLDCVDGRKRVVGRSGRSGRCGRTVMHDWIRSGPVDRALQARLRPEGRAGGEKQRGYTF